MENPTIAHRRPRPVTLPPPLVGVSRGPSDNAESACGRPARRTRTFIIPVGARLRRTSRNPSRPSSARNMLVAVVLGVCLSLPGLSLGLHDPRNMTTSWRLAESVYDFTAKTIRGEEVSLRKYDGLVLIIVNVASKCSFTEIHYKELVELDQKYRDKGLRILAFPCDQFSRQEPGTPQEIFRFALERNVQFDLFQKINVNGNNAHPLWKYLKYKKGGLLSDAIKWNFTKFIIDRTGQPAERHAGNSSPLDIERNLEKYF